VFRHTRLFDNLSIGTEEKAHVCSFFWKDPKHDSHNGPFFPSEKQVGGKDMDHIALALHLVDIVLISISIVLELRKNRDVKKK